MKQFDFLTDLEKLKLAQFLKRVSYDTAFQYSEGNYSDDRDGKQKENAYFLLDVFSKVQNELKEQGYAPR